MRIFFFIISYLTLINCSFDTKSGIWKNPNYQTDNIDPLKEFETVISTKNQFAEKININKNFRFNLPNQISGLNWNEIFYNRNNNLDNFKFFGENKLKFKSKKLTKFKASKNIFYSNGNVILSDLRGNIIVFSVKYNKIVNNLYLSSINSFFFFLLHSSTSNFSYFYVLYTLTWTQYGLLSLQI